MSCPGQGHESGKYMALTGLSDSIPRSIGPVLAPGVIALGALTTNRRLQCGVFGWRRAGGHRRLADSAGQGQLLTRRR
ncbi:hypothetical protein [Mycobacteroides abscessus]|uniref:hypothetical protein n=1 Tax=Mycobacteroides abscessus TaxID=36809 RepID=UPI0013FD0C44|nr:hypothetical protein [Mycobacteroides abscessus]